MADNSHVPPQASRSELEPHVKDAAKLFGVSERDVWRGIGVIRMRPDLVSDVETGRMSLDRIREAEHSDLAERPTRRRRRSRQDGGVTRC
jgi:hypothetical protein